MSSSDEIKKIIKNKVSGSIEECLSDMNLDSLFEYKQQFEKQNEQILLLKTERDELIQEMDNFKKVSIFKSMTEQITSKNEEVKILKSILKTKEQVIKNLRDENISINKKRKEEEINGQKNFEKSDSNLKEHQTLPINNEPSLSEVEISNSDPVSIEKGEPSLSEVETSNSDSVTVEKSEPSFTEVETSNSDPVPIEKGEPSLSEVETSNSDSVTVEKSEPSFTEVEARKDETLENNPNKDLPGRVIKKLKGKEYYIIDDNIFEISSHAEVGKKVGEVIFKDKKKRYKFNTKK